MFYDFISKNCIHKNASDSVVDVSLTKDMYCGKDFGIVYLDLKL